MKISQLIKPLSIPGSQLGSYNFEVAGISCDSRKVGNDFVFAAIKGSCQDGSRFIEEAIKKGSRAVVCRSKKEGVVSRNNVLFIKVRNERVALAQLAAVFYNNPSRKMHVAGITGTNGKTTVSYLLEALVKESNLSPAVIGTINCRFRNKVFVSRNTTPGPVELQSMMAEMLENKVDYVAMEVSSHALDQERTAAIYFSSAIFTNLTQDHLDYHKTKENYFSSKAKLFEGLDKKAFACINCDDKYASRLTRLTPSKIITYGLENKADVSAVNIRLGVSGSRFKVISRKNELDLNTRLIGKHNIYNMLAAFAWAEEEGLRIQAIKSALENFSLLPGRLEKVNSFSGFTIFVDYAHTEDALKNTLAALRPLAEKRVIVVFGCGGERDKTKRPKMGKVVSRMADFAIITNDNPRSEDPRAIIKDIRSGISNANFCVVPDRLKAIKKSLSMARKGDIVLVAGKGHENYQIIKNRVRHFDDKEAIRSCLK